MLRRLTGVVAAACACAVPSALHAQGGFGFKGGLSYGNVSNSGALPGNLNSRTGFAAGLSVSSGDLVGFGLEGLYAQRGMNSSTPGDARRLDYVDVPLTIRVQVPGAGLAPFAYAGPQASFEMDCKTGSVECPDTGRPKTTYAGVIGAGLRLTGGLSLEGRYVYGLTDLKLSTINTAGSYKTRSFLLLMGIGL